MSLVKCPECGREISDKATACPHCGCPLNTSSDISHNASSSAPRRKRRAIGTIVMTTIVILVLATVATWYLFFRGSSNADERIAYDTAIRLRNEGKLDSLCFALNDYLDTYNADAYHYSQMKELNDCLATERADWQAAVAILSLEKIRYFIDIHPDGLYYTLAAYTLDSLSYVEAFQTGTREAYEHYLNSFPQGGYVTEARQKIVELDKVRLTLDEKMAAQETLVAHFDALADNNRSALAATLATQINSYIGKASPELEDIYAYMQSVHASGRFIVFQVKNANVTKVDVAGRNVYNVQFSLDEETYTRTQLSEPDETEETPEPTSVKRFTGAAVLNSAMKITSLVLRQ